MKCKFCNTEIKEPTFDLGNMSLANSLIKKDNMNFIEKIYPLILYVCPKCFLVQIEESIGGEEIFDEEYVYFSSYSKYWLEHAKRYVNEITNKLNLNKDSFVVEVASNDGYLLKNFVNKNIPCLGVEPTYSTASEAIKNGVPTLIEFFNSKFANKFANENKKADLIIANNVLAHVPQINDFISAFKILLKENGTITIEFPHVINLIKYNQFDTIYHEHFFYFSLYTLKLIFEKHLLSIYDVEKLNTHGGSLRIYITHLNNAIDKSSSKVNVEDILKEELELGINSFKFYQHLKLNAFNIKLRFLEFIVKEKLLNKKIIAFGAAAKGNTFLNYSGIRNDLIDYVVDETPYKQGKYMPQSRIPIVGFEEIEKSKPDIIIILPWNHQKEIIEKISFAKEWGAMFIVFIPELKILNAIN